MAHKTGRRLAGTTGSPHVERLDPEVYGHLLDLQREFGPGVLRFFVRGMVSQRGHELIEAMLRGGAEQAGVSVEEYKRRTNETFTNLAAVPPWADEVSTQNTTS